MAAMTQTASVHHCTCPQRIRADIRQTKNRKRERTPARRAEVQKWCEGKTCTCGCGKPANTPHHPNDGRYDDEYWADLRECEPWYHICHRNHHKGWIRCPECGGWMRPGFDRCYLCSNHGKTKTRKPKVPAHPCRSHLMTGRCRKSPISQQCTFAARNALKDCQKAQPRGTAAA